MEYHAHVYWSSLDQQDQALHIREQLKEIGCQVGQIHNSPIGPHPLPMFQAVYNTANRIEVESLLESMQNNLSILLHESINDDVRDHTDGARWLGETLSLDLEWLENYIKGKT